MKRNNLVISDYRYERKFIITELSKYEVESIVKMHPAIFSEKFCQRSVNNIYFDSFNLSNYYDNIEGVTDRIKVRVRWYGDLFGYIENHKLEIKVKKGLLGKKISLQLKPFNINKGADISDILNDNDLDDTLLIDFKSLKPSLLNRYSRKYYLSSDGNYRITIDSDQSFFEITHQENYFQNHINDKSTVILELKYNQEYDYGVDCITSKFPFRITKSSKYVSGIQYFYK